MIYKGKPRDIPNLSVSRAHTDAPSASHPHNIGSLNRIQNPRGRFSELKHQRILAVVNDKEYSQLFDRNHPSVQRILAGTGGIEPSPRLRFKSALTLAEREEISQELVVVAQSIRSRCVSGGYRMVSAEY